MIRRKRKASIAFLKSIGTRMQRPLRAEAPGRANDMALYDQMPSEARDFLKESGLPAHLIWLPEI